MSFKTAKEILEKYYQKDSYYVKEAIEMRGIILYSEEMALIAMNEYAAQFITPTKCYNCDGTGMVSHTECIHCKGHGKVILLPTITNTAT